MMRDEASLLDALIFARRIIEFTSGMDEAMLTDDLKTQAAVLYEITVLGEALNRISSEFRQKHPEIPYAKIIGMRNRLVHKYDDVNIQLVWSAIMINIPELIMILENIVSLEEP